jgi:Leucine-rich repeat (LRR) protein
VFVAFFALAESTNLICDFTETRSSYECTIQPASIFEEGDEITISGDHQPGFINENVTYVNFATTYHGRFVVNQIFQTFTNLHGISIDNAGLHRIQEDALAGGADLYIFNAIDNPLRSIGPRAFSGAPNLTYIDISRGLVQSIDETAFEGLEFLTFLELSNLQLKSLPPNIFSSLKRLRNLWLNSNFLTTIHGELFANNPNLNVVNLSENRINAIGENIFDGISFQLFLRLTLDVNRCASANFVIMNVGNLGPVREKLAKCFENFKEIEVEAISEKIVNV